MTRDQLKQLEDNLWSAADNLRANSDLKATEYSTPRLISGKLRVEDLNIQFPPSMRDDAPASAPDLEQQP
jgi:type I restriction enzyme M protein